MDNTIKKEKNCSIELLRIIFTIIIIVHHYLIYSGSGFSFNGYIAVEFFFIVSGYFLMDEAMRRKISSGKYLLKRIARMYPMYLISVVFTICFLLLTEGVASFNLSSLFNSLLLIQSAGVYIGNSLNGTMWYLSVLLVLSLPIYAIASSDFWKNFKIFIPLIILIGYTYIESLESGLETWDTQYGIYIPLLRGGLGMLLGCVAWDICNNWRSELNKCVKIISCAVSVIIIVVCLFGSSKYECVAIIAIAILFVVCAKIDANKLNQKLKSYVNAWGGVCYPAYLNHILIIGCIIRVLNLLGIENACVGLILSVVGTFVFAYIINWIYKKLKNIFIYFKKRDI